MGSDVKTNDPLEERFEELEEKLKGLTPERSEEHTSELQSP